MVNKSLIIIVALFFVFSGFLPTVIFADTPTGNEPWGVGSMEANTDGSISSYKIINLTNKDWQDGLNIWWRANIPCGTFTGSGLTASWDRATKDCVEIGTSAKFGTIAVFIENPKFSGKERIYEDADGPRKVEIKDGFENLIVYAEYPEEGRKHGFGTSLLYADKTVLDKYASVKEGTTNTVPLPGSSPENGQATVNEQAPEATPVNIQPEQAPSDSNVPWVPIAIGVIALGGAAYYFRNSLNLNRLSILTQAEKKTEEFVPTRANYSKPEDPTSVPCYEELENLHRAEKILRTQIILRKTERAEEIRSDSFFNGSFAYFMSLFNVKDPHDSHVTLDHIDEAKRGVRKAEEAYNLCLQQRFGNKSSILGKPADYAKPEGTPEDPEAM